MNRFERARAQGRYLREVLAAGGHGLWQGEPKTDRELVLYDGVIHAIKAEEREEMLATALLQAVRQGFISVAGIVEPAGAAGDDEKRPPKGRRSKREADVETLRDIRAQNPKSDGWAQFRNRLTKPLPRGEELTMGAARRRYAKAAAILEK